MAYTLLVFKSPCVLSLPTDTLFPMGHSGFFVKLFWVMVQLFQSSAKDFLISHAFLLWYSENHSSKSISQCFPFGTTTQKALKERVGNIAVCNLTIIVNIRIRMVNNYWELVTFVPDLVISNLLYICHLTKSTQILTSALYGWRNWDQVLAITCCSSYGF